MYQNIFVDKKEWMVYLWDDEHGMAKFPYPRYAYRRSPNGKFKSLYGDTLDKVYNYDDRDPELFESDLSPEMRVLIDAYDESDDPSTGHKVVVIDIEVSTEGGFPDITEGDKAITAIALYDQVADKYYSLILDPEQKVSNSEVGNVVTRSYRFEEGLLEAFLNLWQEIQPSIVSGWNCNNFDLPYLFNRLRAVLGKAAGYRLSPIGTAYQNKFNKRMTIAGISCLDYLELYKKFLGVMKPSYSLANVAKDEELKHQKLTYRGNLNDLYKNDIHRFVEYNLVDVKVVIELDKKYDFIHLAQAVCHKGHVPYEWFQMSSRWIDGAILMYLHRQNLVAPNKPIGGREEYADMEAKGEDGFTGAYVKEPIAGLYDWIYSADITSLYPSVIMSLNISPEKKVGKILDWDFDKFNRGEMRVVRVGDNGYSLSDFKKMIADNKFSISSNGVLYYQDKLGVVPTILDTWFRERIEYRALAKKFSDEGDKEQSDFYGRRQLRQKIFLNCFSPDTKVMTKSGVKYISDVKVGDLVYSLNKETGDSELKPVTRTYEYDYDGDMVHFNSHHMDFMVTPNHKFWVSKIGKKKYKQFSWEDAGSIIGDNVRRKFPLIKPLPTFDNPPGSWDDIDLAYYARLYEIDYTFRGEFEDEIRVKRDGDDKQGRHTTFVPRRYNICDWIEFMGWYISEGSLYTSTPKEYKNGHKRGITYKIHIAQEVYHSEIKELLERMKIPFYEDAHGFSISNDIIYRFLEENCGVDSATKKIPEWVLQSHPDKQRRLYKSLMMGDGHKRGDCYTTKSKELKDGFLKLCFNIGDVYAFVRDYDGCYRIQINKFRGKGPTLKSNHRKLLPYKGKVYCVEVQDNHTLLCGRNDKYQWCGQSVYGVLGLPIFRFYDRDNAEATTISGQTIIRHAETLVNDMYKMKFEAAGVPMPEQDFVKYIDTDSLYVSAAPLAKLEKGEVDMTKFTINLVTEVANHINRFYEYMIPKVFNVAPANNRIKIVPDVVAKKALWIAKKRYVMLKVYDMEKGKPVKDKNDNEGKLEVKGIDTVRSSFPASFRKMAGSILDQLLRGVSRDILDEQIMAFEETIDSHTIFDLSKTSSVRYISKDGETTYNPKGRKLFQFPPKTPAQVKAALAYNDFLQIWKLDKQVEKIENGAKVKWVHLLPNDFCIETLAMKADDTDPDQILDFVTHHIDRRKMYDRELHSKLEEIWRVIGWQFPNRGGILSLKTFDFSEEF